MGKGKHQHRQDQNQQQQPQQDPQAEGQHTADEYTDQDINCKEGQNCQSGGTFTWTAGEQAFYANKGFGPPVRCKPCRDANKEKRSQGHHGQQRAHT